MSLYEKWSSQPSPHPLPTLNTPDEEVRWVHNKMMPAKSEEASGWNLLYQKLDLRLLSFMNCENQISVFFFFLIFIYLCASGVLWLWGLVLWPEIYPMPPALGVWSLSPWTTREITYFCFLGLPVYGVLLWHPRQTNTISVHKSLCFVVI